MKDDSSVFNGIDATTGEYLVPQLAQEQLAQLAIDEKLDSKLSKELEDWFRLYGRKQLKRGPRDGIDPDDLGQCGWGVVCAQDVEAGPVLEALSELLDHRKAQAGRINEARYVEYTGDNGYREGETKSEFLARRGVGFGPADPDKVPYYLLLVGSPDSIPFELQYQLDVQYAVGRIHFDTLEEYERYARSVVAAENQTLQHERRAVLFGPANPDDEATRVTSECLLRPLADELGEHPGWSVDTVIGTEATKHRLGQLLQGVDRPDLLFTASHGVVFPYDHEHQRERQGALVCQDWPGRNQRHGPVSPEHYFAAADLDQDAGPQGMISFHFACFSSGTPRIEDFAHQTPYRRRVQAPSAFLARLPQQLLAHPAGGALASVGHVDLAWGHSFEIPGGGYQTEPFRSTFARLMTGHRLGWAMELFNQRYAEISSELGSDLEAAHFGKRLDLEAVARQWTARNDARDYVVLGDPAVCFSGTDRGGNDPLSLE